MARSVSGKTQRNTAIREGKNARGKRICTAHLLVLKIGRTRNQWIGGIATMGGKLPQVANAE